MMVLDSYVWLSDFEEVPEADSQHLPSRSSGQEPPLDDENEC